MKNNSNIQVRKFKKKQFSAKKDQQGVSTDLMPPINCQKRVLGNSINQPGRIKKPSQKYHTYANQLGAQSSTFRSESKAQKTQYSISMSLMNQEEINAILNEIVEKSNKITKLLNQTTLEEKDIQKIYEDVTMKINLGFLKVKQDLSQIEEQIFIRIKKYNQNKQCIERYKACQCRIQTLLKNRLDKLKSFKSR